MSWSGVATTAITGRVRSTTCWHTPPEKGSLCMHELEHAEVLVGTAERDLAALRGMSDETVFASPVVGFRVQRATEKPLEAWLPILGIEYP